MAKTVIINELGVQETVERNSSSFKLIIDEDGDQRALAPAVTQSIEVESNAVTARTGTLCGDKTMEATATDPFKVTIQGIVGGGDTAGALSLRNLLFDVHEGDFVRMVSDWPIDSALEVSNVVTTQEESLVEVDSHWTDGAEKAFSFTLTLGEQESTED